MREKSEAEDRETSLTRHCSGQCGLGADNAWIYGAGRGLEDYAALAERPENRRALVGTEPESDVGPDRTRSRKRGQDIHVLDLWGQRMELIMEAWTGTHAASGLNLKSSGVTWMSHGALAER
jgi:hypothetical protein